MPYGQPAPIVLPKPVGYRRLQLRVTAKFEKFLRPSRYKALKGGRGSAKSHFYAELLVLYCLTHPATRAVCIREVQKSLANSAKLLIEDKIRKFDLEHVFRIMEDRIITPGGGVIIFQGMQNHTADSIKSLEGFMIAWVEEAHSLSQRSLDLLRPTIRLEGSEIWFSWNPDEASDPVDKFFANPPPNTIIAHVTYRDNLHFPQTLREEMLYDKQRDWEKYLHVWLGHYRKHSEARVFRNWRVEEFYTPANARFYFGADWGYSADPTVLIRSFIQERKLFVDFEAWGLKVEIDHSPALFAGTDTKVPERWKNPNGRYPGIQGATQWPIRADSARPDTISYFRNRGFNVVSAKKGPNSVSEGVEFLKSYDIIVHPRCTHVIDELTNYSYEVDDKTGEVLPTLADKKNHTIDSLRYALELVRHAFVEQGPVVGTYGHAVRN